MIDSTAIRTLAREMMDKVNWQDKVKAKSLMWRAVKAHDDSERLLEDLARYAIDDIIDDLWRRQEVPTHVERENKPRMVTSRRFSGAVESRVREWLLDERIADGAGGNLIMRDATKAQILAYGAQLIAHGTSSLKRGHYFVSVAEMMKKLTDKVGAVLVEEDLQRAWVKQGLPLKETA